MGCEWGEGSLTYSLRHALPFPLTDSSLSLGFLALLTNRLVRDWGRESGTQRGDGAKKKKDGEEGGVKGWGA
jgi:hypothetical protein